MVRSSNASTQRPHRTPPKSPRPLNRPLPPSRLYEKGCMKTLAPLAVFCASHLALGAAEEEGFRPLFNGKDTTGWHLRNPQGHNSWSVEKGILKNTVDKGSHGTDLVTDKKFWNFTVKYEFMVPENSNSGFYLRGRHEIQILGDHASGQASPTGNGAIYNFKAPDKFVSRP